MRRTKRDGAAIRTSEARRRRVQKPTKSKYGDDLAGIYVVASVWGRGRVTEGDIRRKRCEGLPRTIDEREATGGRDGLGDGEEDEEWEDRDQVPSRQGAVKSWASFWSFLLRSQNGLGMLRDQARCGQGRHHTVCPSRPADPAGI